MRAAETRAAALRQASATLDRIGEEVLPRLRVREVGVITDISEGIVRIDGLPGAGAEELLLLPGGCRALAVDLHERSIGAILLDPGEGLEAGMRAERSGRVLDVPVGDALIGRVVDPLGRPRDRAGPVHASHWLPVERDAPAVLARAPVAVPLQTGLKVIDALVPIGRGQRQLILGDRQTGKTSIALDTILNQRNAGVICIYCAIGQQSSAIARAIATLREGGAMDHTVVVSTTGDDPAGLQFVAPYAAMAMAEHFMEEGRDAVVVFDDITRHARSYRELSLLLERPPGREAYPGDIFYVHARLLERATHLREAGGSLTALPILEIQEESLSAYIPTNLISITDGQLLLSPRLFRKGQIPAVDVGLSVSRVGGDAQLPAYTGLSGNLRLAYAQFEELERFSRYGARLDPDTERRLEHGRRVRAVLRQDEHDRRDVGEQIAILLAVSEGLFDSLDESRVAEAEERVCEAVDRELATTVRKIRDGEKLDETMREDILDVCRDAIGPLEAGATSDEEGQDR